MTSSEDAFFAAVQPPPDRALTYGPDADQVIDVFESSAPADGLVVLIHGGFWRPTYDRRHLRRTARGLADTGWAVASLEYRRVPGDPDSSVDDVVAATELARREFPDGLFVIVGHSAGGHLALVCAVRFGDRVTGVVPIGGVVDLSGAERLDLGGGAVRAFLGCSSADRTDLDPMRLPLPHGFIRPVHGGNDGVVPAEISRRFAQRDARIELADLPGVDHFGPVDPDAPAWSVTLDAINRRSRPA